MTSSIFIEVQYKQYFPNLLILLIEITTIDTRKHKQRAALNILGEALVKWKLIRINLKTGSEGRKNKEKDLSTLPRKVLNKK